MTNDATPRPNLEAIAARWSNFPAGEVHALVAYALELEKALGAADRMRAELSAWHIDHARGCWGNTNTAVLQRRVDEYDAALALLAPGRGAYGGDT